MSNKIAGESSMLKCFPYRNIGNLCFLKYLLAMHGCQVQKLTSSSNGLENMLARTDHRFAYLPTSSNWQFTQWIPIELSDETKATIIHILQTLLNTALSYRIRLSSDNLFLCDEIQNRWQKILRWELLAEKRNLRRKSSQKRSVYNLRRWFPSS